MKKNRFAEFFKGKGYYVLLFVGVIAIAAVAIIGSNLSESNNEGDNYVDLNEEPDNAAGEDDTQLADNNPVSEGIVNSSDNLAQDTDNTNEVVDNDSLLEYDVYTQEEEDGIDLAIVPETPTTPPAETAEVEEIPDAVETAGTTVKAANKPALESLSFDINNDDLLWPVNGNVIMNYSMDHTVYHPTLMLYKCNPAIILDAEVGTEVKSATQSVVTNIEWNEETGHTVTTAIGDGFSLVYGQLDEETLEVKVGDRLDAGEAIGTIADPTKYYTVEGSNLYFKVLREDNTTINPMLLLTE